MRSCIYVQTHGKFRPSPYSTLKRYTTFALVDTIDNKINSIRASKTKNLHFCHSPPPHQPTVRNIGFANVSSPVKIVGHILQKMKNTFEKAMTVRTSKYLFLSVYTRCHGSNDDCVRHRVL